MVNEFSTDNTYREAYKKQQEEIINLLKGANIPAISDPVLQKDLVQKQNEFLSQYGWGVDETGQTYYKGGGNIDGPKPLDPKLGSSRQATPQELGNFGQSATLPPTFSEQMALAQKMGITNYTGTPEQKAQLQKGTTTGTTPTQMGTQTGTPTQQFSLTSGNLQQGSKDVNVGQLQSILNQLGGYGLKEDNIFGPKTREAVMAFQKANGLVVDGIVGPKTTAKINELLSQKTQKEDMQKGVVDSKLEQSGTSVSDLPLNFAEDPFGTTQKIVDNLSKTEGLGETKTEMDNLIKEKKELEDKKNQEANDIRNNPWISEGLKQRKLGNLDTKYEGKLTNINNSLGLLQDQYNQGLQKVQYLTTTALNQYNQSQPEPVKTQVVEADGKQYLINSQTGERIATIGTTKTTGTTGSTGAMGTTETQNINIGTTKPLNATQSNDLAYADRIASANPTIDSLESYIINMNPISFKSQIALEKKGIMTGLVSDEIRQYMQSNRNFINATLRKESGAVISDEEFENAFLQYLPRPGDDTKTLEYKKTNREAILNGMLRSTNSTLKTSTDGSGVEGLRSKYNY